MTIGKKAISNDEIEISNMSKGMLAAAPIMYRTTIVLMPSKTGSCFACCIVIPLMYRYSTIRIRLGKVSIIIETKIVILLLLVHRRLTALPFFVC